MKKLVSLLLCIALMLPVLALAEGAAEWVTLDYEDFSMQVKSTDILQQGEKSNGSVLFTLYPDYADADVFHSNINCAWISNDLTGLNAVRSNVYHAAVNGDVLVVDKLTGCGAGGSDAKTENNVVEAALKILEQDFTGNAAGRSCLVEHVTELLFQNAIGVLSLLLLCEHDAVFRSFATA